MNKFLFFSLLLLVSCNKISEELDRTDYDAEFAIPIIKDAALSFIDLWQDNTPGQSLIVQPDGGLVFRYESEPIQVSTKDILGELEFPIISGLADTLVSLPFVLPANIVIEEATIAGGFILFQFQAISEVATEITFTLPHITLAGVPLVITTDGFSGTSPSVDLTGYTFEPEGNELVIQYTAKDLAGNSIKLEKSGVIARPRLAFVKGTWGREEFQLTPTTIPIDLYDERFLNGNLRFTEPTITANIESSFGVPIRSRIDLLNASTKRGEMPIDASAIDGVDINYPLLTERGVSKTTVLQIDYTNSNIVDVFDAQLTELQYGLTAIANPEDNQNLTVFIEDTSTFKAEVIVDVPVIGRTENFVAIENFATPFEDIDQITAGEFKLIVENELPVGAQLQFYFLKADKSILDSLFQTIPQLVEPASIDEKGNVLQASETTTFIPLTAPKMQQLLEADQVQVKANFQTAAGGQKDVIIKAAQQLKFRMGLKFKI